MSGGNDGSGTAVHAFKVDAYAPGSPPEATPTWIGRLTREETDVACPRHQEVQQRTDAAAEAFRDMQQYMTPQRYGTAVHTHLHHQIRAIDDPNFRSEVSLSKVSEETYGTPGSIRIDVLERVGKGTVCVYDIKTGKSGLSATRSAELVGTVYAVYDDTSRIILIETRPKP